MTAGKPIRLGAVGYLNARPLVYGLEADPRFDLRYDIPAECARLLHSGAIDVGLVPSIEYLRGPQPYMLVPGAAVTSCGPVASVAIYSGKHPRDIRTIAMDSSSRTSVVLATVLLHRLFGVSPEAVSMAPDLDAMLARADAALLIGDYALFLDPSTISGEPSAITKLDLGELWSSHTGLPFVYAFWTAWPDAVTPEDVDRLQRARHEGASHVDEVAAAYYADAADRQAVARRYLRDNIRYAFGEEELDGLRRFYGYAAELGLATFDGSLRIAHAEHHRAR